MAQRHYIGKVNLQVAAPRSADGFALQEAVSLRFWQAIAPALSDVFDRFAKTDELIRLDRLDIHIDRLSLTDWEEELGPSVYRAVEEALERLLRFPSAASAFNEVGLERLTVAESLFAAWLFFLKTGQLSATASTEADWQEATLAAVASDAKTVDILRGVLLHNAIALERLVLQHNEAFLTALAEAMTGLKQAYLADLRQTFVAVLTHDFFIKMLTQTAPKHSAALPIASARRVEVLFWQKIYKAFAEGNKAVDNQSFIRSFLKDVFEHFYKKDMVSFLSNILVFEETVVPKQGKTTQKGASKPPTHSGLTSDGVFNIDKDAKTLSIKALAPSFVQCIENAATNTGIGHDLIAFFKKEIDSHHTAIIDFVEKNPSVVRLYGTHSYELDEQPLKTSLDRVDDSRLSVEQVRLQSSADLQKVADDDIAAQNIQTQVIKPQTNVEKPFDEGGNLTVPEEDNLFTPEIMIDETFQTTVKDAKQADDLSYEEMGETDNPLEDDALEKDLLDRLLPKGTSLIAPNAGVVLLHPFLKPMFESLGLLRGGKFVNIKARRRAAALIHYLATGSEEMAEYDMALPKLLVGLPLHKPMDRHFKLTELECTDTDGLLQAVLSHWKALGSTTPDGLREGFLKRNGKLTHRSDGWLLQVEAKTLDILLDRLPWGFGIVQLSWMKEMLFVEWH